MSVAHELLDPKQFEGMVGTVTRDNPDMDRHLAERITEEAIKFVAAAAQLPGRGLRPSRIVDEGWHALILHTKVHH